MSYCWYFPDFYLQVKKNQTQIQMKRLRPKQRRKTASFSSVINELYVSGIRILSIYYRNYPKKKWFRYTRRKLNILLVLLPCLYAQKIRIENRGEIEKEFHYFLPKMSGWELICG